jgi:DNA-binding ferritin-like protein
MKIPEKVLSWIKTIGIAILSFITLFILGKLFAFSEEKQKKREEEIKDALNDVENKLNDVKDVVKDQNTIINNTKDEIKKHELIKDEISQNSIEERIEDAINAGFKRK